MLEEMCWKPVGPIPRASSLMAVTFSTKFLRTSNGFWAKDWNCAGKFTSGGPVLQQNTHKGELCRGKASASYKSDWSSARTLGS